MRIEAASIPALLAFAASLALAQAPPEAPAPDSMTQFPYRAPDTLPRFPAPPRRYSPPEGFSGYDWGTLRSAFSNLPTEAAAVRASWTQGKRSDDYVFCTGRGLVRCTPDDFADVAMRNHYKGDGFHVLSEYYDESQGYLKTRCDASIVLSIDPDLGRGIVLFSTPALWQYAHARESIGEDVEDRPPDPLYTLLHGLPYERKISRH